MPVQPRPGVSRWLVTRRRPLMHKHLGELDVAAIVVSADRRSGAMNRQSHVQHDHRRLTSNTAHGVVRKLSIFVRGTKTPAQVTGSYMAWTELVLPETRAKDGYHG